MIPNPLRRAPGARWGVSGGLWGLCLGLFGAVMVWATGSAGWNAVTLFGAAVYGSARLGRAHPGHREAYRQWLARTPWRWPQPLPYRSPFLSWNDTAFVLAAATLCPWGFVAGLKLAGLGFALGYVLAVLGAGEDNGLMAGGCFVLACLAIVGFVGPAGPSFTSFWMTLAPALVLSQFSLNRGLRRLSESSLATAPEEQPEQTRAGAPYRQLLGDGEPTTTTRRAWVELAIALLLLTACGELVLRRSLAWVATTDADSLAGEASPTRGLRTLIYFGEEAYRMAPDPMKVRLSVIFGVGLFVLIPAMFALTRMTRYAPPISVLGRLATGRLFLPGYDFVWMLPAGVCAIYLMTAFTLFAIGASPLLAAGLGLTSVALVLAWLGPAWERWKLTGPHRIVMTSLVIANKQSANHSTTTRRP